MFRFPFTLLFFLAFVSQINAQVDYKTYNINGVRSHTFEPRNAEPDFKVQLINLEAPSPDGDDYRAFLMRQKIKSRKEFPVKKSDIPHKKSTQAQPIIGKGFGMKRILFNGTTLDVSGGIPNDNAFAISNDGLVLSGINSLLWAYDLKIDSNHFPQDLISLANVAGGRIGETFFDPKLIYDEKLDRFILVFLKDSEPAISQIIVCFSQTNDPLDGWNVFRLPGNPLNNNSWTDFPSVNITDNEVFITGNLIDGDEPSWQLGFDGSVIWQIDKNAGYNNDSILPSRLYAKVSFNGKYTRNVHPVRGVGSSTSQQYFMSNRNFDITNDTIFVMKIDGPLSDSTTELKVTMAKTNVNYGVPPNGRQQDTDLNDPTKGLQTNDGRVLGAITNGDWIQFVSTTMNPQTGFAGIYHGWVNNPTESNQSIKGTILSDPILDFGYPNIAFAGNDPCDIEVIIGLNFTSPLDFPGVGTFYFGNDSSYSDFIRIKDGLNYTDRHSDSYERWGDYFGIQPKFNEPGTVWLAGYRGLLNRSNGTWINEVKSPDSDVLIVNVTELDGSIYCKGGVQLTASGGIPPYQYSFNDAPFSDENILDSLCQRDTVSYSVMDGRGCTMDGTYVTKQTVTNFDQGVYPNPASTDVVALFYLDGNKQVEAYIYDMGGNMVKKILNTNGKKGLNELHVDISPLSNGIYSLKVLANGNEVYTKKIMKSGN